MPLNNDKQMGEKAMFLANSIIGGQLAQAVVEGGTRVALNSAKVEEELFAKAVAEGNDLPDCILTFIRGADESLGQAKQQGKLPSEWVGGLMEYAATTLAHHLDGSAMDEAARPAYYRSMDGAVEAWAKVGIASRPAIVEAVQGFAKELDEKRASRFEAALN